MPNTIRQCDGLVDVMSYWAFSDVFEEQGVVKRPFYGGFGLMAAGNIPKAAYNAFALLHHLGTLRLEAKSDAALITKDADGALAIAVWNYAPPGEIHESGAARNFTLSFKGFPAGVTAWISVVDRDHGSSLTAWEAVGRPDFPLPHQQEQLRAAGRLPPPEVRHLQGENPKLELTLAPHALALVEIEGH